VDTVLEKGLLIVNIWTSYNSLSTDSCMASAAIPVLSVNNIDITD